jgi:hypothetical protein
MDRRKARADIRQARASTRSAREAATGIGDPDSQFAVMKRSIDAYGAAPGLRRKAVLDGVLDQGEQHEGREWCAGKRIGNVDMERKPPPHAYRLDF